MFNKNADDASVDSTKNCVNVSVKDMTPEKTVCVISWESYGETVYFAFLVSNLVLTPNNVPQRSHPRALTGSGVVFLMTVLSVLLRFAVAISGGKFVSLCSATRPQPLGGGPLAPGGQLRHVGVEDLLVRWV